MGFSPSLIDLAAFIGIGGVFLAVLIRLASHHSLRPTHDPRLAESLAFHNIKVSAMVSRQQVNTPLILTVGAVSALLLVVIGIGTQAWFQSEERREIDSQVGCAQQRAGERSGDRAGKCRAGSADSTFTAGPTSKSRGRAIPISRRHAR